MKRQKRKVKKAKSRSPSSPGPASPGSAPRTMNRRDVIRNAGFYGAAALILGGGGFYLVDDVRADARERDLSRIGNGVASVVQIHDPGCPRCLALQRQTREALEGFDDADLQYLVADINTAEGRELAARYGVGHVTLLLMDGEGKRVSTLRGEAHSGVLADAFARLIRRSRARS